MSITTLLSSLFNVQMLVENREFRALIHRVFDEGEFGSSPFETSRRAAAGDPENDDRELRALRRAEPFLELIADWDAWRAACCVRGND